MWHALRAELVYFCPWLLGGMGIAVGVVTLLSVVFTAVGNEGPPPDVAVGLYAFFPIIAGMVVGFIAQAYRAEERRARLLLAGPLTPFHLAGVTVLLPAVLFAMGALASVLVLAIAALVTGHLEPSTLRLSGLFAGVFFASGQMGPLAQESTAARRERRGRAATIGWAIFGLAILGLTMLQWLVHTVYGWLGYLVIALLVMATSLTLYTGRTDFTQ